MLTLDLPTTPYWLALPRGVRVEIRPVTTAVMAAAQAASARRLSALRAAEPELDPDMARGLAFAFLVKALARHAIFAWEGIPRAGFAGYRRARRADCGLGCRAARGGGRRRCAHAIHGAAAFVADPFPLWAGLMDVMEVTDGAEARISLTCESRLVDLERAEVRRYTDADQQAEYQGDRFFEYVPALQEAEIRLPAQ